MLFSTKTKAFDISGRPKIQIIVDRIDGFEEDGYTIASGVYSSIHNETEGGYAVTIKCRASSFWKDEKRVDSKQVRMAVKIDSAEIRRHHERGIIGGGVFDSECYLEVEINVDHHYVRDLLYELRRTDRLGVRLDGYALSEKVIRIAYFRLFIVDL
ncbi:MAG: hypothetical protein U1E52_00455 [Geminicoccaceae bacterium]